MQLKCIDPEIYSLQCESRPEVIVDIGLEWFLQTLEEDDEPQVELDLIPAVLTHKEHWVMDILACYLQAL